jgi:putative endonuclease
MLACADGSLYTGVATDLQRRLRQHNGELVGGAKYTSSRRPVRVVWQEACASRAQAQQREAGIKKLDRVAKLALLAAS